MPHKNSPADHIPGRTPLGAAIREEARRHEPDSAAIRARVECAMASGDHAPGRGRHESRHVGTRLVTPARVATAGVAALSVAGGGAWFLASQHAPVTAAGRGSFPRTAPHGATHAQGGSHGPGATNGRSATSTPGPGPQVTITSSAPFTLSPSSSPGSTGAAQKFLSSHGAVDPASGGSWGQSDVTLTNTSPVTGLSLVLRLAATPGLTNAGSWSNIPNGAWTVTVTTNGGTLVYTFTLNPGQTLKPGKYEFAGQYTHATGARSASGDTYQASATSSGSSTQVSGNFAG